MFSQIFNAHRDSFILIKDNADGTRPTYWVYNWSKVPISEFPCGVLMVPTDSSLAGDTHA